MLKRLGNYKFERKKEMLKSKLALALVCVSFVALTTTGCLPQKKEAPAPEPQVEQQAAPVVEEEQAPAAEEATTEETTETTTEETTTEEAPAQ